VPLQRGINLQWFQILKIKIIGKKFSVDGKTYHFNPEQVKEYKKEYNNPYISQTSSESKKRIALRNVIRKFNIQGV
jgi:hypothetical protein